MCWIEGQMVQVSGGGKRARRRFQIVVGGLLASLCCTAPVQGETKGDANAVTVLLGRGTDTVLTQIITEPWTTQFVDLTIVTAALSARLGTVNELTGSDLGSIGDYFSFDLEAGAAYHFEEEMGEFWGAIFLRYDGFPWNDAIYTTIAASTGLDYITETSEFEKSQTNSGQTSQVLHYLAPEITFADPDNKNIEWVVRLHHRSGVFGLINDVTGGSTFVTTGLRVRF
jgi:hypothetical protein